MTAPEIQRLRAEVRSDRGAFSARVDELESLDLESASPAVLAQAAVALHHAYGAIEAALARIARALEGSVPHGPDWHQQRVHAMTLDIPSVRPAVLSAESAAGLRRLLAFRHFFRHAYAVGWDASQLGRLRGDTLVLRVPLARDLDALDAELERIASVLSTS